MSQTELNIFYSVIINNHWKTKRIIKNNHMVNNELIKKITLDAFNKELERTNKIIDG